MQYQMNACFNSHFGDALLEMNFLKICEKITDTDVKQRGPWQETV